MVTWHLIQDVLKKLPGLTVVEVSNAEPVTPMQGDAIAPKPYFIGMEMGDGKALPKFSWEEKEGALKRTPIL